MSPSKSYNLLHLRAEDDWVQRCARWATVTAGKLPDPPLNCCHEGGAPLEPPLKAHHVFSHIYLPCPLAAGSRPDNCMNHTVSVGEQLHLHRVDPQVGREVLECPPLLAPGVWHRALVAACGPQTSAYAVRLGVTFSSGMVGPGNIQPCKTSEVEF